MKPKRDRATQLKFKRTMKLSGLYCTEVYSAYKTTCYAGRVRSGKCSATVWCLSVCLSHMSLPPNINASKRALRDEIKR